MATAATHDCPRRCDCAGSSRARTGRWQQLVQDNLALAGALAHRLRQRLPRHVDVEELRSDAYLGLVQAAQAFEQQRACRFSTYATPRIWGAMLDGLRARRVVTVPRGIAATHPVSLEAMLIANGRCKGTVAESVLDDAPPVGSDAEQEDQLNLILAPLNRDDQRLMRRRFVDGVAPRLLARENHCSAPLMRARLRRLKQKVRAG